ncbi:MAG TPA: hypothetical protein VKP30_00900 [Polyangiaceae bacterium]|nr:hypothetical protein [Polyangiaceae bacterium]
MNAGSANASLNESSDPIEAALARLLDDAAAAGDWGLVARLANELEARRKQTKGAIISLDVERAKRGGK